MCATEPCTTGETTRAHTRAKVVISCSTFSNADHGFCENADQINEKYVHAQYSQVLNTGEVYLSCHSLDMWKRRR